ncbi:MAG: DUF1501 domain-containing protein, partial [Saprospiraceae bacterium]|nr:DUF1501 domain-containing protein [Saprospiraceae bacterium]
ILIQMNGGNDGLNMVIPIDQYEGLMRVRSNIALPESKVLKLTDKLGLHSRMTGLATMYKEEKLGILQSVGYPNQNRSHFRSTDIWNSASTSNEYINTGWIGRFLDSKYPGFPEKYPSIENPDPFALTIGSTVSQTCEGASGNFGIAVNDPKNLRTLAENDAENFESISYGEELKYLQKSILQTNAYSKLIQKAAEKGKNLAVYPTNNSLANQLKSIALLISGGLKSKVYIARIGGFDTHANQTISTDNTTGTHAELLGSLSTAIEAFQKDLELLNLSNRVVGMTYSEFGRQIQSNNSGGTDHGNAAPLFLFGTCVQNRITGENVQIPNPVPSQAGVSMQIDFRNIYGSILVDWFGVKENEVKQLIFNDFVKLPIIKNCQTATPVNEVLLPMFVELYPNPTWGPINLTFQSVGGDCYLHLMNGQGQTIKQQKWNGMYAGEQNLQMDVSDMSNGIYFVHIRQGLQHKTMQVVLQR